MKRFLSILAIIVATILVVVLFLPDTNNKNIENNKNDTADLRACWFSFQEWKENLSLKNKDDYISKVNIILNNVQNMHCNVIYLHIRAFGDAMYKSEIFAPSKYCYVDINGHLDYDPLELFIQEAQKYNIEIHGWINPMRTMDDNDYMNMNDKYILKQWYSSPNRDDYFIKDQVGRYILIPANPEVCDLIAQGVSEILDNYNISGIHIDDYFYPSGIDGLEKNDRPYYDKIKPDLTIEDWRRDSTSNLVKILYNTAHSKKDVLFGISPQANLDNNYNKLFIDIGKWVTKPGFTDYIMPQIYFGFDNSYLPFQKAATQWSELITSTDVKYYVGLAGYKLTLENDANAGLGNKEWHDNLNSSQDILKRQVEFLKTLPNYSGYCLYTYNSFFNASGTQKEETSQELKKLNDLI